jgi:tRNA-Thr(GGU) m(6)t(6)A37 methyltransferase TsaA
MTDSDIAFDLKPIGFIRSEIRHTKDAPLFYDEGAPGAIIDLNPEYLPAILRMGVGDEIVIITWLHQANRGVLQVHPRGNAANPITGVFLTRSPHRPNPLGLHRAKVTEIDSARIRINAIEAIDGTPVVDIKVVVGLNDD